jgi:hypothetical protein
MKSLTLTTALIAALVAPVIVNAGTAADIFAAEAASNDELVLMAFGSGSPDAAPVFLAEALSDDERNIVPGAVGSEVISTQSFGANTTAARIIAAENAAD